MSVATIEQRLLDLSNVGSELTAQVTSLLSTSSQSSLPEQLTLAAKLAMSTTEDFANISRDLSLTHFGLFPDILKLINGPLLEITRLSLEMEQELNNFCCAEDWKEGAKAFLSTYNGAVAHATDLKREFLDGHKKKIKYYASSLLTDLEGLELDSLQKGRGAQIQIADALHEAGKNSLKLSKYVNDSATGTSGLPRDELKSFSKTLSQKAQEVVDGGNLVLQSPHNHEAVLKLTVAIQSLKNELRRVYSEPGNEHNIISPSKIEETTEYLEKSLPLKTSSDKLKCPTCTDVFQSQWSYNRHLQGCPGADSLNRPGTDSLNRPGTDSLNRRYPGTDSLNRPGTDSLNRPGADSLNREYPGTDSLNRGYPGTDSLNRGPGADSLNRGYPGTDSLNDIQKRTSLESLLSPGEGYSRRSSSGTARNRETKTPGVYRHFCIRCLESFATLWSLTRHEKMVPDCALRSTHKTSGGSGGSGGGGGGGGSGGGGGGGSGGGGTTVSVSPRMSRPRSATSSVLPATPLVSGLRHVQSTESPYRPPLKKKNSEIEDPFSSLYPTNHTSISLPTLQSPVQVNPPTRPSSTPQLRKQIPPVKIQNPAGVVGACGAGAAAGGAPGQSPQLSPRTKPSWRITSIVVTKKPENLPFPSEPVPPVGHGEPPSDLPILENETVDLNQIKSEFDLKEENQLTKGTNGLALVGAPHMWTAAALLDDLNNQLQVLKEAVIRAVRVSTFNSYEVKQQLPLIQYTSENPKIAHPEIDTKIAHSDSELGQHICGQSTLYLVEHNTYPGHPLMMNMIVNYESEGTCLAHHYEGEYDLMTQPDRLPLHPNILRTYHHFVSPIRVAELPGWTLTPLDAELMALCVVMPYAPICLEDMVIAQRKQNGNGYHPTNGESSPPLFDLSLIHLWLRQLLRAVEFLHKHYIVHRALSPAAIRFTSHTAVHTPLMAHLGVSLDCTGLDHFELPYPTVHVIKGGPRQAYTPPEVVRVLPGPDAILPYGVCDEWALGKIIYELVCDEDPYRGKDVRFCLQDDYVPLKGTDSALAAVVEGLLRLDPQKRMSAQAALEIIS